MAADALLKQNRRDVVCKGDRLIGRLTGGVYRADHADEAQQSGDRNGLVQVGTVLHRITGQQGVERIDGNPLVMSQIPVGSAPANQKKN
jgi:hypothetical protein